MVEILADANKSKEAKGGRKNKLRIEDLLLLAFEYMRGYRTCFHIAKNYGVSESSAYKSVVWVENMLIKHLYFALPGKRELTKSDNGHEVILVDATETLIERPKKNKNITTQERRKDTQ